MTHNQSPILNRKHMHFIFILDFLYQKDNFSKSRLNSKKQITLVNTLMESILIIHCVLNLIPTFQFHIQSLQFQYNSFTFYEKNQTLSCIFIISLLPELYIIFINNLKFILMNICIDLSRQDEQKDSSNASLQPPPPQQPNLIENPSKISKMSKEERKYRKKCQKSSNYNWNDTENRRYVNFLMKHRSFFEYSKEKKREICINKLIGKAVKTRTPTQCHTHHQKMMAKYGSIEAIIQQLSYLLQKFKSKTAPNPPVEAKVEVINEAAKVEIINEEAKEGKEGKEEQRLPQWQQYLIPGLFFRNEDSENDPL